MNWKTIEEYECDVYIKLCKDSKPNLVAIFDGDERVTEPVAALQAEDMSWRAIGYRDAKKKYSNS